MVLPELSLDAMTRHCNNYFNANNDPNDPERNYPDSFIFLAKQIDQYITEEYHGTRDPDRVPWPTAFARELGIYKRAKFI